MSLIEFGKQFGMPFVLWYFAAKENAFLNTVHTEAAGCEFLGNCALQPYHYLFSGKKYSRIEGDLLKEAFLFPDKDPLILELLKTAAAIFALPFSLIIGSILKGFSREAKQHTQEILAQVHRIPIPLLDATPFLPKARVERAAVRILRPAQRLTEEQEKELHPLLEEVDVEQQQEIAALPKTMVQDILALKDLGALLDAHGIPWWVDCGTLLGVYRHEGIIPWDHDIDIAILEEYHDPLFRLTQDPAFAQKYRIMDWSPADQPKTLLKLYVKQTRSLIDIYHYRIHSTVAGEETITYLSPYYSKWFMPFSLKVREEFCLVTQPLSNVFPLQHASFDGVQVHVPHKMEEHLKGLYQDNLTPAKIWDPKTKSYHNVPGHPYWKKCDQ